MPLDDYLLYIVIPIICLAFVIMMIRFIKGPHVVDRVIVLDLIITSGVGLIGIFCIMYHNSSFLDTAIILALIAFLSTIAFSYYLDQGKNDKK